MKSKCHHLVAILNMFLLVAEPVLAAGADAFGSPTTTGTASTQLGADVTGPTPPPSAAIEPDASRTMQQSADAPLPLEEPIDPDKYVCGAGDLFQLNFWGRQNSAHRILIDPSGKAFVPRVGYVQVADLVLKDALVALRQAVARYYPRLNFDFSLVKPRSFLVHVVGAVPRPGIYNARATDRVSRALMLAGWNSNPDAALPNITGSMRRIEITRRKGGKITVDLLLYNLRGDTNNNPQLVDGDVVTVPFETLEANITGAVQRPGRYELVGTKDLAELVDIAGGLRPSATRQLPIILTRRESNSDQLAQYRVAFPQSGLPALPITSEDAVHVPSVDELQRSVMLVGAIQGATQADEATGIKRLPYQQGDTVRTLIERAGGVGAGADYKGSYIVRMQGTEQIVIPLDLEALLVYRNMKADRPVRIGDIINVPYQRHSIMVEGAVMRPGVYQFNPRLRPDDYIALAGGPSKMAQDHDTYRLVSPKGKTELISEKTAIQPGDTLVVPERHFSRAEVTQIIISGVGLAVTATALVITATR
jgi:protein involved in polysaccharide export with SLBB domain